MENLTSGGTEVGNAAFRSYVKEEHLVEAEQYLP